MNDTHHRPLTLEEATEPSVKEPAPDVRAWQDAKVRAGLKAADAGDFAHDNDIQRVIRKYIPDG